MMGAKSMLILKTHFDSINPRFINGFLYENLLWILGSVRVFLCNYVLYSFGLILNYIFRFQVGGDRKADNDQFPDSEVDGFREELINFLFESYEDVPEDVYEDGKKSEGEANSSVSLEVHSDSHESKEGGVIESSVLRDAHFNFQKDGEKSEGETERSVLTEAGSDFYEDEEKSEGERECFVSMEAHSEENKENSVSREVHSSYSKEIEKNEGETESSVFMEFHSDPYEDVKEREEPKFLTLMDVQFDSHEHGRESEGETECCSVLHEDVKKNEEAKNFVSKKVDSDFQEDDKKKGETESYVLMGIHSNVEDGERRENEKGFDLIGPESEMSTRKYQFVSGGNIRGFMEEPTIMSFTFQEFYAAPNVLFISDNNNKFSEHLEEEEEGTVQENQFLGCNTSLEGLENESLKQIKDEGAKEFGKSEEMVEKEGSKLEEEETQRKKNEAEEWKKMLAELESDEEIEGDLEWEHDDIVEQLKMEIKNARQGGLPTILEEEEQEQEQEEKETEEEAESPEVSEAQKLLKIEDRLKFEDQMDEIQDVYLRYEEKMRKLDILNYQTMHGLGLLQLKDPLKSTFSGAKPAIMSQNIWGRREAKKASDPIMKLVGELQRDLEMVYVGQICLSWEMLCWQHNKALHLKQHHSNPHHHNPHFNVAAGEFQLFQVLIQRFIENEPFQGPRTHNFVKNRCVIRNLIQVPPIADDSMKEKNMGKEDDEEEEDDAVCSGKLAEIIKESMWLFWRFVRADKDDGSFILRFDHLKDPALSDLVKDIRTILHKKERRLKEIVRSGNCIVRKLQKKQAEEEEELNHEQMIARVEMKLVSRVLNLSKLRKDHLIWCNEKLNRIKFVKKKKKIMVVVDPSFLLFPC